MLTRAIRSILGNKFSEFLESITDDNVRHLVKHDSMITGGAIASMLLNEDVNDFDIYFRTKTTALKVAEYYVSKYNEAHGASVTVDCADERVSINTSPDGETGELRMDIPDPEDTGAAEAVQAAANDKTYRVLFLSQNAITLSDQIQIIIRFHGEPAEIHGNYDFAHCMNYWTSRENELILQPWALEALLTKELRYVGSKYPLCSIIRTRKFIKRGWKINAGQYLKMCLQLNELDLFDIEVLRDQLVGVDSAHFIALIDSIKEKDPTKINATYLAEIIDRIF